MSYCGNSTFWSSLIPGGIGYTQSGLRLVGPRGYGGSLSLVAPYLWWLPASGGSLPMVAPYHWWLPAYGNSPASGGSLPMVEDLTLNSTWPQFTQCFQATVLVFVPAGVLWISAAFYLPYLLSTNSSQCGPNSCLSIAKTSISFLMVTLTIALIIRETMSPSVAPPDTPSGQRYDTTTSSHFVARIVEAISFVLTGIIVQLERRSYVITSCVLFVYWLILLLCDIVPLYTYIEMQNGSGHFLKVYVGVGVCANVDVSVVENVDVVVVENVDVVVVENVDVAVVENVDVIVVINVDVVVVINVDVVVVVNVDVVVVENVDVVVVENVDVAVVENVDVVVVENVDVVVVENVDVAVVENVDIVVVINVDVVVVENVDVAVVENVDVVVINVDVVVVVNVDVVVVENVDVVVVENVDVAVVVIVGTDVQ
ncbi:Multidrug resistance-associated protein 1 [Bulinus truncatus]|nr:Multidrug resistance-associated protein 1 [Bulinus truncatus]